MTALIEIGLPVAAIVALAFAGWLGNRPEPAHGDPSWSQRAGKRVRQATSATRAWWAARRQLPAEDQQTVDWLDVVHEDQGEWPGELPAPEDVPGREMGSAPWPAPTPAGDTPSAAMVAGETPAQAPVEPHETAALGDTGPRTAGVEPGPEPGTPPAGVRDPVPAGRQWAIAELTGQHLHADTGAFPKVKGVA